MPDQGRIAADPRLSERLRAVLDEVPALVVVLRGPELVVEYANARRRLLSDDPDVVGRRIADVLGAAAQDPLLASYRRQARRVLETGEPVYGRAQPARLPGRAGLSYWDYSLIPLRAPGEAPLGVVIHSVEVTHLVEARRRAQEAEHRFTTLFDANVIGVTIAGDDGILEANDAFLAILGRSRADLAGGLSWRAISPPDSLRDDERALERIRRDGAAPPYEKEYLRPDGTRVPVLISGSRLQAEPLRALITAFDLSERKAVEREIAALLERERDARLAAEMAGARTSRLQEITSALSATSSPAEITRTVVHHALEELSASAALLVRGGAELQLAYAAGFRADDVDAWRRSPGTLPFAVGQAIGADAPVPAGGAADPRAAARDVPEAASAIAAPLEAPGRVLGALLLAFREPRELGPEDREFLMSLARQAAAALERAELFEDRAFVARTLQEGLLPRDLPQIPGAQVAVVYESISGRGEVGGDFYDLFDTGLGGWALTVGDVAGKGTGAAVVTGLARHTLRAVARVYDDPDRILECLNGALRRHDGPPAFCTVACAVIEPHPAGGFAARVSSGGHPYPLVLRASGALEPLEVTGTMLGVADDPQLERAGLRLGRGDALVLYTDGVTDARAADGERFGEARLHAALRSARGGSAADVAAAVEEAVRAHQAVVPADDRAIVVFRVS